MRPAHRPEKHAPWGAIALFVAWIGFDFQVSAGRGARVARLDPNVVDRWGVATLNIHMTWRENEIAIRNDMAISAAEILEAVGARDVSPFIEKTDPGFTIHEMGTARMGRDPKTSVLNGFNQSHDIRNLFITDGACMTSSSCVNPSLTYMALTARACDYAVREMDLGRM